MKAEQAAAPLIRKLNDENWQIRMESASALGDTHDKSAVPHLISLLLEHDWRVKYRAIIALGKLRDSRAIDPLIGLFRKDNDILIKRVVVYSLGEISNSKAVDFLYKAFNDEDDLIKPGVITALEKIGKPSLNVLVKLLKTHDENHYHYLDEILETIGNIGDTRVAAPLIEFIETHDSSSARRFAFIALGKFKDKRSFNLCIDALNDTDNLVKRSALYALSELADPRSLDAIKKVMDTDPVRFIRENARSVLNKIKDELKKKSKK
jgi:HEAT repeat protein